LRYFGRFVISVVCVAALSLFSPNSSAWENGGRTRNVSNPKYGTHDWIAEEALKLLPENEQAWIKDNIIYFLLGTEAPDNQKIAREIIGMQNALCYGDQSQHNNYYDADGRLINNSASFRAQEEFDKSLEALVNRDFQKAAFFAGAMAHYISDLAVWAHVMGNEEREDPLRHAEFERSIDKTIQAKNFLDPNHTSIIFQRFVNSDGTLETTSAYQAAANVGLRTYRGNRYTCRQMERFLPMGKRQDGSYVDCDNWKEAYVTETGVSINHALNAIADVLHTLFTQSQQPNELLERR